MLMHESSGISSEVDWSSKGKRLVIHGIVKTAHEKGGCCRDKCLSHKAEASENPGVMATRHHLLYQTCN